jgi:hypothetical protein
MTSTLNDRLRAIGFRITSTSESAAKEVDIERTLLEAVRELPKDARLASLLLSWIKVHGEFVVVEKLRKLRVQQEKQEPGSSVWLSALAAYAVREGDHRWELLVRRSKTPVYLFPKEVTESAMTRKGPVDWLRAINFIVPAESLRIREQDILSPQELIHRNPQYRNRYRYGPSWRADIASAMERGLNSPASIARDVGCSYEPAYRVYHQLALVMEGGDYPSK